MLTIGAAAQSTSEATAAKQTSGKAEEISLTSKAEAVKPLVLDVSMYTNDTTTQAIPAAKKD